MAKRLLLLLALIAPLGCSGGADEPSACADPVPLDTVRLEDFAFEPDCFTASSGDAVRLENVGDAPHTFTVGGTDVSFDVAAGETAEASLSGVEPGRYPVTCVYHPQMKATLQIEG